MACADMQGVLSTYNPITRLTMFESGAIHSTATVVFIAGLQDSYLSIPCLPELSKALADINVSLTQVNLSSTYRGYGICSLATDVGELDILLQYLHETKKKTQVILLGHSTGCQDSVSYAINGKWLDLVRGIILQAPVSDREYLASSKPEFEEYLDLAKEMIDQGNGSEMLPRQVDLVPLSANRYYSFAAVGGDDDMFSSDLSADTMREMFSKISVPLIMVHGAKDEYMPSFVDQEKLAKQMAMSCPSCLESIILPEADHVLTDQASQVEFVRLVKDFVKSRIAAE